MKRMMRALGPALVLPILGGSVFVIPAAGSLLAALSKPALAQPDADAASTAGTLPPADILAVIRREGFHPVGRPVQRGRAYVLFAVDQDDLEVTLTVDAASGEVLWVTGAVAHFGSAGFYGNRPLWGHHPQSPPADAPAPGHSARRYFPPLPRTRPANFGEP